MNASLESLFKDIKGCTQCSRLVATRRQPTVGYGSAVIPVMFVGLNPAEEGHNKSGVPFRNIQGRFIRSGKPFFDGLRSIGWELEEVYFTELTKCHAPDNRPTDLEIHNCSKYLFEEIHLIKAKLVIALGERVFKFLAEKTCRLNGSLLRIYHPAYIQRGGISRQKEYLEQFVKVKKVVEGLL